MSRINVLERLSKMGKDKIANKIKEALEESGIKYTEDKGGIIFSGLFESGKCRGCLYEFDWGYPGCNDCARMYQDKYVKGD